MKVFTYFVEPARYTINLAHNVHKRNNIDYCFIKSTTYVENKYINNKIFLDKLSFLARINLIFKIFNQNDFIIVNGYNNYVFLLNFFLNILSIKKKFIAIESDSQYTIKRNILLRFIKWIYLNIIFRNKYILGFPGGSNNHKKLFYSYGMNKKRIFLMPMMVNNSNFFLKHKQKPVNFTFLFVGRIELEKGIEGLIHISEVSWTKNVQNLQETFKTGETIDSKVLFVDSDEQKISLGIKQLSDDPWEKIADLVKVGDKNSGTVNKVTKFGAFVSLTDELEGFVRTTDFHWTKNPSHPKEFVNEGDSVEYLILDILEKERKVLLSVKDLTDNPWKDIESKFNSGDKIKGSFEKMNDSGVIIKLDDEIEGLIPMKEISKDQKKNTISVLNEGDSLDLLVVEVKSEEKNITLMLDESNVDD